MGSNHQAARTNAGVTLNPKIKDVTMKKWIAFAALLLPLAVAGCSHKTVVVYAPPPPALSEIG